VLMLYFGKYAYHFRDIVEMFWARMHGAQVPKVRSIQIDEDLAYCDIAAEKLTLREDLDVQSKDT
jgi:hypothetical protein